VDDTDWEVEEEEDEEKEGKACFDNDIADDNSSIIALNK
jgi:hypothetical protein